MGIFGKSIEEKVQSAVEKVRGQFPGTQIDAQVSNDVVTLSGRAPDMETKSRIMVAFNDAVETKNTINQIAIEQPTPRAAGAAPGTTPGTTPLGTTSATEQRIHLVIAGDTLSALAKKYYGDASKYNKIFEANRDQLNDPDKIKVGQKLKIPT